MTPDTVKASCRPPIWAASGTLPWAIQAGGAPSHQRDQQGHARRAGHLLQCAQDGAAVRIQLRRQRRERGGEDRGEQQRQPRR